ncbi:MAG: FAD-dependent oxidoreductase, partial [Acidimicrobiales bacterium]
DHRGPFASHYDSGRVTRRLDAKRQWAVLASRAIDEYPSIEAQSGIDFHRPTGMVFVRNDQEGIDNLRTVAAAQNIPVETGRVADLLGDLPYLSFPDAWTAFREPGPAGSIDPRRMIDAQHRAAKRLNALVARDVVMSIRPSLSGFELLTVAGRTHQARQVLIAAGAYSNQLLPQPLSVSVRPEVVVLGEIDDAEAARLSAMPSIIYLLDDAELGDVYIVPPTRYPDGKLYIKMGGSHRLAPMIDDPVTMNEWMRPGAADDRLPVLRRVLTGILPDVRFIGWRTRPCLITDTPSGLPYIDRIDNGVTVAFGGNGHAAKSADAIGALAAELALSGSWDDDELERHDFAARFGSYTPTAGSRHGN